ncbi:MAG: hypothetical protein H7070_14690 [Saprospiraceae bacterium]|nr:hypothetical protein [Pyrinomonadaceae bacterium]
MKTLFLTFLMLGACALTNEAFGQSCRPAILGYFVRDAKGKNLSEEQLRAVSKEMSQPAPEAVQVALAAKGILVGHSTKPTKMKLAALQLADAADCDLKVGEMTLQHNGMTMRLIFNLDIYRSAYYIDSLPFQNGTFELEKKGLPESSSDKIISAKVWKKIGNKP